MQIYVIATRVNWIILKTQYSFNKHTCLPYMTDIEVALKSKIHF